MTHPPTIRSAADGRTVAVVGDVYRFIATAADTGGKYTQFEAIVQPGGGPPPHVHSREEEGFFVIEGEVAFYVGEQRVLASAGSFVNMPIGVPHRFKNESTNVARMIITTAPAGIEGMFFESGTAVPAGTTKGPPPTHADIERIIGIAPKYGIDVLGPPPE